MQLSGLDVSHLLSKSACQCWGPLCIVHIQRPQGPNHPKKAILGYKLKRSTCVRVRSDLQLELCDSMVAAAAEKPP